MTHYPIRRSQLIAPFGVGALMVAQDGISLISGGLDHWYKREDGNQSSQDVNINGFRVEEWRLQRLLRVDHFCLPPDFRDTGETSTNKFLKVPFLRFPQWHFCPSCRLLTKQPLTTKGRVTCPECEVVKKKKYSLKQVSLVAMCNRGHIQDFPWREWVHKSIQPSCQASMRIISTGGSSLSALVVRCDCGMERTLANITNSKPDGTETDLSNKLDKEGRYMCQGKRPWLGTDESSPCDRPLRGSLRSASNLYYANVKSAIYLPRGNSAVPTELVSLLEEPPLAVLINLIGGKVTPQVLRSQHAQLLQRFSDIEIQGAIQIVLSQTFEKDASEAQVRSDDQETIFRRAEFDTLRKPCNEELLIIKDSDPTKYRYKLSKYFSRIMLISKLRETRALAGFTRIFPENDMLPEERQAMLRLSPIEVENNWLPAYVVYGEGIFLELNEHLLHNWERRTDVLQRVTVLIDRYKQLEQKKKVHQRPISPRFILLHTLSHLVMNRLTFECGYSSAALRERLYVSEDSEFPMAGLLVYTAAGDSEGTMGGLVRMGKPDNLERVIQQALIEACWCSADPVCMEMGSHGGQGPESCNLAACHNCSLVPETACEEFNRFLDRATVVGKSDDRKFGFFDLGTFSD